MMFATTLLDTSEHAAQLAIDVRAGLTATAKSLPSKYFYDATGSDLFDQITRLPEYYLTRAERSILLERADEIAQITRAATLTEIGSGTSEKTRLLLKALSAAGTLRRFVPFDVDPAVLTDAGARIRAEFPGVEVQPVIGDFERHLGLLPPYPRRLVAFLGSTIGNLTSGARHEFFAAIRTNFRTGDAFLLGTDLVKPVPRLIAAYDDSAGVTAAFNKNILAVVNRDLDADIDLDAFEHVAVWNSEHEWVEMRLQATRKQKVRIAALGLDVIFQRGEHLHTEISAKFRHEQLVAELSEAGLRMTHWWTDPAGDFALSLSVPAG
jgi:L-histidine Nalpha-methyltransferase